jgi:peptidoglycan/xylan/chitin deacetylase (PgdA/CDA1 family)
VDVWPETASPTPVSPAPASSTAVTERTLAAAYRVRAVAREAQLRQTQQARARAAARQKAAGRITAQREAAERKWAARVAQQKAAQQKLSKQRSTQHRLAQQKAVREGPISHIGGTPSAKVIYLTFDDGPSPEYTSQVLALLARYHARAVFCQVGTAVREHPEITRQIVAAGHALCDHTLNHDERLRHRSAATIHHEIDGGLAVLQAASPGTPVRYFRAPGGNWSPALRTAARRHGMSSLTWTVDPRDWSKPGVAPILSVVRSEHRNRAVVLLHDGGGAREQTVAALGVLLPELAALGYRFEVPPPSMFSR